MRGMKIGPYTLVSELGAGAMGAVWRASCPDGADVAVKIIHPHLLKAAGLRERVLREARAGRSVTSPHVVRTIGCLDAEIGGESVPAIVLELVEGRTLADVLATQRVLPEDLCRFVGREIARALEAVHAAGIVHRDVKPGNVMLTTASEVRLMDLGLARLADGDDRLSMSGLFVGTAAYAPPEQFMNRAVLDPRSDLWSVGAVLFEMATGRVPFEGDNVGDLVRQVLRDDPPRPGSIVRSVSPFLEEVILTLLRKEPDRRFASAAEFGRVLEEAESGDWWMAASARLRAASVTGVRRVRAGHETALWGREDELGELRAAWADACAGRGSAALIEGEAGIGKTRLIEEFVAVAEDEAGAAIVTVGASEPGVPPAAAVVAGLRSAFALGEPEDELRARLGLDAVDAAVLARTLRCDSAASAAGPVAPSGTALPTEAVHAHLVRFVRSLAAERPFVLVVDDLHLAPPEGLALFSALAGAADGHRFLVLGTARPGLPPRWVAALARLPRALRREIRRLDVETVRTALARQLGGGLEAEDLAAQVATRAGGNPYFVVEMLRHLRDRGLVSRVSAGGMRATGSARDVVFPGTVRDLVAARLAALSGDDRVVLAAAACQGAEFDGRLVAECTGLPRLDVLRRLGRLEHETGVVRAAGARFAFDHHILHEVLYESLDPQVRERHHGSLARRIEERAGVADAAPSSVDGALCATLAGHSLRGPEKERAKRWVRRAIVHLTDAGTPSRAAELGARALAVPGLFQGIERMLVLLDHAAALGSVSLESELAAMEEALSLVRAAADRDGERIVLTRLSWMHYRAGRFDRALTAADEAEAVLALCPGPQAKNLPGIRNNRGVALMALGRFADARRELELCIESSRETTNAVEECHALTNLGNLLDTMGEFAEAVTVHGRAAEFARRVGEKFDEVVAIHNLGNTCLRLGRPDDARIHLERAVEAARRHGFRRAEMVGAGNLGNVHHALGLYGLAISSHRRHLSLARETGYERGAAMALCNLARLFAELGDEPRAAATGAEALAASASAGWAGGPAHVDGTLAVLALRRGDAGEAEARLRAGAEPGTGRATPEEARLLVHLGEAALLRGRRDDALARFRAAADSAPPESPMMALALARTAAASADATAVREAAAAARAILDSGRVRLAVDLEIQARHALWRADGNPADLARAKELVAFVAEHAPDEYRATMTTAVPLLREIAAA